MRRLLSLNLAVLTISYSSLPCFAFQVQTKSLTKIHLSPDKFKPRKSHSCFQSIPISNIDDLSLSLDNIPTEFQPLFSQAALTTAISRKPVTDKQAHDPFRFEWGTWVDEDAIKILMERVDEVMLTGGAYEKLLEMGECKPPLKFKVASGQDWDCLLHVLPQDTQYQCRSCTGSWTILKSLTGVAEIAMLRETRDGGFKKSTKRDLRGGTDGSFGGGAALTGEDCIKYVGGPLRSYMGKSGNTVLFELVVRPSISVDVDTEELQSLENIHEYLTIQAIEKELENNGDNIEEPETTQESIQETTAKEQAQSLGTKLDMTFDQVGGLDSALDDIVRRVLASRANPEAARRLGISHVRGILLSGPPGKNESCIILLLQPLVSK